MKEDVIALFEFEQGENGLGVSIEKHYKLVPARERNRSRSRPLPHTI